MATAAAAVIARARRDIQHEFFAHDAVRADRAIVFHPGRLAQRRVFERWQRAGVIREVGEGRYWLDVTAYDVELRKRYGRLRIILWVFVALVLVGLISGVLSVRPS